MGGFDRAPALSALRMDDIGLDFADHPPHRAMVAEVQRAQEAPLGHRFRVKPDILAQFLRLRVVSHRATYHMDLDLPIKFLEALEQRGRRGAEKR